MTEPYPVYECTKKDCRHYRHKEMFTKMCCGQHIIEVVELIYCAGIPANGRKCLHCKRYEPKEQA